MKAAVLCLIIITLLFSCQRPLEKGVIVEQWHEDARVYPLIIPVVISTGKTRTVIPIPYIIHDGEDWCIKVNGLARNGDTITNTYYINLSLYGKISVGDSIKVSTLSEEDMSYEKEEEKK